MNEETETSDLIGQWLPVTASDGNSAWSAQIRGVIKNTMKVVVKFSADFQTSSSSEIKQDLRKIFNIHDHFDRAQNGSVKVEIDVERLEALKSTIENLQDFFRGNYRAVHDLDELIRELHRLMCLASKLKEREQDKGIAFSFVKSDLVNAIENGWWVLLDGVNSAPPEVIERLNSLLEDNPMLNLIEDSDGKVLKQGDGIHSDFRFFATANVYRKNSNKLSSAFLNRMIRIWLPKMDSEIQSPSAGLFLSLLWFCLSAHVVDYMLRLEICLSPHIALQCITKQNYVHPQKRKMDVSTECQTCCRRSYSDRPV